MILICKRRVNRRTHVNITSFPHRSMLQCTCMIFASPPCLYLGWQGTHFCRKGRVCSKLPSHGVCPLLQPALTVVHAYTCKQASADVATAQSDKARQNFGPVPRPHKFWCMVSVLSGCRAWSVLVRLSLHRAFHPELECYDQHVHVLLNLILPYTA